MTLATACYTRRPRTSLAWPKVWMAAAGSVGDEHLALGDGEIGVSQAWATLRDVPLAVIEVKDPGSLSKSRKWLAGR